MPEARRNRPPAPPAAFRHQNIIDNTNVNTKNGAQYESKPRSANIDGRRQWKRDEGFNTFPKQAARRGESH